MRSIGRLFQSDAVAGGDQATAETDPGLRESTRTSADGHWWWDGGRWVATSTPDGLWEWDGEQWRPTIELRGVRPHDLATTLAFLAEDRYARAAAMLVERAREWRPAGPLRDAVRRAEAARRRPLRPKDDEALLDDEYRGLLVHIGRHAPRPTVKEADDLLDVARVLDVRSARMTEALAAADEAERARIRAIETARRELHSAESGARAALEAAGRMLARAEQDLAGEREAARGRLRRALDLAGAGVVELLAEVGPLRACPTYVETPAGRLAAAGAHAWAAPAPALWREQRDLLADLLLLQRPDTEAFERCLVERRRDLFLLLETSSRTILWHCPPGEEKALRRFATAVNQQSARAAAPAEARLRAADEVRAELAARTGEAASAAATARAAAARAEAEAGAAAAVETARRRLEKAWAEPRELVAARQQVAAETRAIATPPAPLA